jgi:hypothetical protein
MKPTDIEAQVRQMGNEATARVLRGFFKTGEGLKVIRGQMAPRYFRGRGHKRGGKPSGHRFGDKLLGVVEARLRIYRPTSGAGDVVPRRAAISADLVQVGAGSVNWLDVGPASQGRRPGATKGVDT